MGKTSETYLLSVVEVELVVARLAIAVMVEVVEVVVMVIIAKEEKQLYLRGYKRHVYNYHACPGPHGL